MSTDSDRLFQGESTFPQYEEWFYRAREGIAGPYLKREDAALALGRFIRYCQQNRLTGGREMPAANPNASQAWRWLAAGLEQSVPAATWLLGVLFGRITGG